MNSKAKSVVEYYVLCNKLKNVIRTGWKDWNVQSERVESVAEHVYGVQQLAIAMWSQYNYNIDISKVLFMLAIHELEETILGDLTMWNINAEDKLKEGHKAVAKILDGFLKKEELKNLIYEFDARETEEAKFAYFCDKLECDIQSKLYDEAGTVDLLKQEDNPTLDSERVKELLNEDKTWSEMWLGFGRERYDYDSNFIEVSNYVEKNKISLKEGE